jgi:hypothetical protein
MRFQKGEIVFEVIDEVFTEEEDGKQVQCKKHVIGAFNTESAVYEDSDLLPIDKVYYGTVEEANTALLVLAKKNYMVPLFTMDEGWMKQGKEITISVFENIPQEEYMYLVKKYLDLEKAITHLSVEYGIEKKRLDTKFKGRIEEKTSELEEIKPSVYSGMQQISTTGSWERWVDEKIMVCLTEDNRLTGFRPMEPHELTQGNVFDKNEDDDINEEEEISDGIDDSIEGQDGEGDEDSKQE